MATSADNVPAAQPAAGQAEESETRFSSASLYVGDLHPDATEQDLMDVFGALGPISSIRLLRDAVTRRSLRYAYVNFQHPSDAERALDTLNFSEIRGQSIRVMWLQRDPSVRKSGRGNIFIKNLPKDMDHKGLYDICSPFGNILSCKVATLPTGLSKGYGYVHYETQEAAELAIKNINGMNIDGSRVVVEPFVARKDRGATADVKYNNVYVKNVAETVTEEKLTDLFAPFGPVSSVHIKRDENGVSKGFGFVTFDDHDGAKNAVDAMNGKEIEGKVMYAGRAQKKAERQAELRRMFEQMKLERASKYQGVNLYVKNLDDVVDDDGLRKLFEEFGNITSAKVMRDDKGNSRGFGFVCFTTPEEATRAVTQRNGQMIGSKPLYVAIAQKREYRQQQLAAQYAAQRTVMPPGGMMPMPTMAPMPNMPPNMPVGYGRMPMSNVPMPMPMGYMYGPRPVGRPGFAPGPMPYGAVPMPRAGRRGGNPMRGGMGAPKGYNPRGGPNGGAPGQGFRGGRYPPQHMSQQPMPQAAQVPQQGLAPIDFATLSQMDPAQQKQVLGAALYPRVAELRPAEAGKITGMLLEIEPAEVINLLESPEELRGAVNEAASVLESAAQQQPTTA